jgi:uncharacterized repeat protein (TIGR01451 family)
MSVPFLHSIPCFNKDRSGWFGLLMGLLFLSSPGFGQFIGGLPDPEFNPKDTGAKDYFYIHPTKSASSQAFAGKGRDLWMLNFPQKRYFTDTLYMFPGLGYISVVRDSNMAAYNNDPYFWQMGTIGFAAHTSDGQYGLRCFRNYPDTTQMFIQPVRLEWKVQSVNTYSSFLVPKTKRFSNSRAGWEKSGNTVFLAFGYHQNALSQLPDRLKVVQFPDSMPFTGDVELANFNFQYWVKSSTGLLVLGNTIVNGQASQAQIQNLNFSLASQASPFQNLPAGLIFEDIESAVLRSDGAIVVGGTFRQNGVSSKGFRSFLPGGSSDPGFPTIQIPVSSRSKTAINAQQELVLAYSTGASHENIQLMRYSQAGQLLQSAPLQFDNGKIGLQPELFHVDRNQWLVKTDNLNRKLDKQEWFGSYSPGDYRDSSGCNIDRIWVNPNGRKEWMSKTYGLQLNYLWWENSFPNDYAVVNPYEKKMAVSGPFSTYQNRYTPGLLIMDIKGDLDTAFVGIKNFPPKARDKFLTYGFLHRFLPVEGNKAISFRTKRWYWRPDPGFSDTVMRWLPNGQADPTFQPYRMVGIPVPGPDSLFYSLRFSKNGQPVNPDADTLNQTTAEVIKINRRGEFVSVQGSFIPPADSIFAKSNFYTIELQGVDARGNAWVICNKTSPVTLARVSPNGQVRFFKSDSLQTIGYQARFIPLISQGPNGRITLVGNLRQKVDTTVSPTGFLTFNTMEFDSSFHLIRKIRFDVPDAFGDIPGNQEYLTPWLRLPDGKFICYSQRPNVSSAISGLRTAFFRYHRDGRLDPTFIPIDFSDQDWPSFWVVMSDRLYTGFGKRLPSYFYGTNSTPYSFGTSKRDGLHCFLLNSSSADYGFVQGKIQRVIGPTSGCNPPGERFDVTERIVKDDSTGQLALTDREGFFSMPLMPGTFSLRQQINNLTLDKQICPSPLNPALVANLDEAGEVSMDNNFLNQGLLCPRLTMQLNMGRFRLCATNRFSIRLGNDGLAAEPNARIRLNLPPLIKILSANAPFTIDSDSAVTFDIGNLNPGEFRTLNVVDTIGCPTSPDSIIRACFSARMEPIAPCNIVPPATLGWDGAWLDAVSRYNATTQKVRIVIRNRGDNMGDSVAYSLRKFLANQLILSRIGKVKLAAGDSLAMLVDADEFSTIGLNVGQTLNCPLGTSGSLGHFGRNASNNYLAFWDGWLSRQTFTACPPFRYSYDPNEKLVEPSVPFVDAGTTLDYTIHFENFGNDTAFTVVVVDSLPAGVLPETFEFMGSSHPCRVNLSGTNDQSVLTFAFVPIKLAAKKQDSVLSKGQLSFRIRLKDGLEPGSEHQNRAFIFFDRNEPIITNFAVTRITPPDVPTNVDGLKTDPNRNMTVFPNPNRGDFEINVPEGFENSTLRILDTKGIEVKRLSAGVQKAHSVKDLPPGVYFIQADGLQTSRMVVLP